MSTLQSDDLIAEAQRVTGLSSFGPHPFRDGLERLLASYRADAALDAFGVQETAASVLAMLVERLRATELTKRHPEIASVAVEKPLFVIGLPRSGTTMLHNLLSQGTDTWSPLLWELTFPSAPLSQAEECRAITQQRLDGVFARAPQLRAIHFMAADAPDECYRMVQHSFVHEVFEMRHNVSSYSTWLDTQDLTNAYRYYRSLLQLLLWRRPGKHLVFKCPFHLWHLEALVAAFPDARFVYIHRDPLVALTSFSNLCATARSVRSDRIDRKEIGAHWLRRFSDGLAKMRAARLRIDEGRILDIHYRALLKDPTGTIERIMRSFEMPFDDATRARVTSWLAENPQGKHGAHKHDLESLGLQLDEVESQFADYKRAFSLEAGVTT